jgi:RNA polymerase sigma-B factor
VEGRIALDAALPYLEERERTVLRLRFVEDLTQSQIADQIGHSQMHVSRILRRALSRIRERIESERGHEEDD